MQMREKEISSEANEINKKHNNTEISRSVNTDGEKPKSENKRRERDAESCHYTSRKIQACINKHVK